MRSCDVCDKDGVDVVKVEIQKGPLGVPCPLSEVGRLHRVEVDICGECVAYGFFLAAFRDSTETGEALLASMRNWAFIRCQ